MIVQSHLRLPVLGQWRAPEAEEPGVPAPALASSACDDLRLAIERGDWPHEHGLARLVAARIFHLTIATPLALDATNAKRSLEFLRFNRDCLSFGIHLDWTGTVEDTLDSARLSHLVPPRVSDDDARQATWARDHSYGRCYWRNGPGFVLIKDTRAGGEPARFVLDEPDTVALFRALASPKRADETNANPRDLSALLDEGLVLSLDGWLLALPSRMRRWPIPALAL